MPSDKERLDHMSIWVTDCASRCIDKDIPLRQAIDESIKAFKRK